MGSVLRFQAGEGVRHELVRVPERRHVCRASTGRLGRTPERDQRDPERQRLQAEVRGALPVSPLQALH